ncbi:MAG: hypothetical protein EBR30_00755 [Cytophagia bacterium]|jgi:hypothetical protein|nr:hypothetical protein [Cytophagia bacterium]
MNNKLKKIGIIGTQCIGKSTLIEDMMLQWPQLSKPERTYRDLVKEKNLPVNKNGTKESQEAILNFLVDEAMENVGKKKLVYDRTPLDNLAYSLWLYEKGESDIDEAFIDKTVDLVRNSIRFYSVLFYLPLIEQNEVPLTAKEQRDIDPVYRAEIDVLFDAFYRAREKGGSRFFYNEDCPMIIPIYGNPLQRIAMIKQYINDKCEFYGEEDSLIAKDLSERAMLAEQLQITNKNLPKRR